MHIYISHPHVILLGQHIVILVVVIRHRNHQSRSHSAVRRYRRDMNRTVVLDAARRRRSLRVDRLQRGTSADALHGQRSTSRRQTLFGQELLRQRIGQHLVGSVAELDQIVQGVADLLR